MEHIKYLDLKPYGKVAGRINVAYDRVFNSSTYIGGKEVTSLEDSWAEYCESKYCVGVGNGHDALMLACKFFSTDAYHIHAFAPWKTCLPTWSAIRNAGLFPRPIDSTSCVITIAVHIYGQITIPERPKINVLIEDCAQAHGSRKQDILAGKFGRVAAWSFYPTKNLGAMGDAGAVTTDDLDIANFVREMRNYGTPDNPGINSRLDPLQAAILRAKLPYLDEWNERRRENAQAYFNTIVSTGLINLPYTGKLDEPNWHIFAIETDERNKLQDYLSSYGIETMVHYPDVPYPSTWNIPEAEAWTKRTLSLPVAPHVTPEQCRQIGELINRWQSV